MPPEPDQAARRVLIVTDHLGGGTGSHMLPMIRRWQNAGWSAEIICLGHMIEDPPTDISVSPGPPATFYHRYPIAQVRCLRYLWRRVAELRPDVLHCYFFWPIVYGRVLRRLGVVRLLFENREDEGFSWGRTAYAVLRLMRRIPDCVICVSDGVKKVVLERERLTASQALVIRNGVPAPSVVTDDALETRRALGIPEASPVVGLVAHLNRPVKGVSYFIDAVPRIVASVPDARFVVIGEGPLRAVLERQAEALGVRSQVVFAGYSSDVARYYRIMDVSAMTSLSEGLSITLLESMSHALPVVVTNVGGNSEVVVDGESGYLVPVKDVEAFAERVVVLLRDANLRERIGQSARQVFESRFEIESVAASYLSVYSKLLENSAGRRNEPSIPSGVAE